MLDVLERDAARLLAVEPKLTTEIVARNAALKAGVVLEDEREGGRRVILNYGHTIGHAIEAVCGYRGILHGEAISAGMMAAAGIGRRIGLTPAAVGERQARLFERYSLPPASGLDVDAVIAATAHDKKVAGKRVRWVLLEDTPPCRGDDVPEAVCAKSCATAVAASTARRRNAGFRAAFAVPRCGFNERYGVTATLTAAAFVFRRRRPRRCGRAGSDG
jgi:3-dehydroquinate synthetase